MEKAQQTITLPVTGQEAVIQEGDGYSDRVLLKKKKRVFEVVPEYLASMTVSIGGEKGTSEKILDLPTPDQEFLAIEIFKLNYGNVFEFSFSCPNCDASQEGAVDLSKLEFMPPPEPPVVQGKLPRTGLEYSVGMLTGKQEALLFKRAMEAGPDLNQADFLSLLSLNGSVDFSYEDVIKLPLADHRAIRKARKKLICGYDTQISVECEKCEETTTVNMLLHPDFFFAGG